jgi:hypothetical protein
MRPKILQHEGVRNPTNRVQIQGVEDERELSTSTSTITSIDFEHFPSSIIDYLDEIYSHRRHKRCINLTYLTLLSMTCAVIFWMIYWLIYDSCEELRSLKIDSFSCKVLFIFKILIFSSIGLIPFLFIFMIISWCIYSCNNPIDEIRKNFIGFRLEGNQWENQLNYYFKKQINCFSKLCLYQRRKRLIHRNFGYIILSSHGIIFDELFLLTSHKNILINGILINNEQILKLEYRACCKNQLLIYLPEELINPGILEEFMKILKIKINILPQRF